MTGVTATDCCDGRIAATDHDDADTAPWCPEPGGHNNTGSEEKSHNLEQYSWGKNSKLEKTIEADNFHFNM